MTEKENALQSEELRKAADKVVQDLAKIAFANIADFARFEPDGSVHIFDYDKAREVGAKVSVVTRKVGRGKNAREVRKIRITMPDKLPALIKLGKHLGLFQPRWKRK
jgi:phage terminase small subunit